MATVTKVNQSNEKGKGHISINITYKRAKRSALFTVGDHKAAMNKQNSMTRNTNNEKLRYDSFAEKYQGTSAQVLNAFGGIFFLLVWLKSFSYLQSITGNAMFKEPIIRHSYLFSNVPSHECHSWKVDDGSSILSRLMVQLSYDTTGCKKVGYNDNIHRSRQRLSFNMSFILMRISSAYLQ